MKSGAMQSRATHTVADQIVAFLAAAGVQQVFGLCGHTVMAVLDALHRAGNVRFISTHHEQVAAHAADAAARLTGQPGVVLTHLGPGLTNAATGVANAALDSVPLVVIAGDIPSYFFGRHAHQEIQYHADADQWSIYRPFVKRAWRITGPRELPRALERAWALAQSGRPGPVLLDVAMDVFSRPAEGPDPQVPPPPARPGLDPEAAERIARLLWEARRPVILAGGGVIRAGAAAELVALAEYLQAPVAYTLMGKGAIPEDHPLAVGMTGFWGTPLTNRVTRSADVLLAVGSRFPETDASSWDARYTFQVPPTRLVHIDIDPQEIGRSLPVTVGAVADARQALRALYETLQATARGGRPGGHEELQAIRKERQAWWASLEPAAASEAMPMKPERILADLRRALPREAVLCTDVGWNKNGVGQQFPIYLPGTHLTPGGLATMGFGPAAALGAKAALPGRPVVALVGDGAFAANPSVVATAVEEALPVAWVVLNNGAFGTIANLEQAHYGHTFGTRFGGDGGPSHVPDWAGLARSLGAEGWRIAHPAELGDRVAQALRCERPCVIDVPMTNDPVPTGGHWDINDIY